MKQQLQNICREKVYRKTFFGEIWTKYLLQPQKNAFYTNDQDFWVLGCCD